MSLRKFIWFLGAFTVLSLACDTKTKNVGSCGDGFLDPGEMCDGGQMTAATCVELGYYGQQGVLTCKTDCTFDLSVCTEGRCGDGVIQAIHGEDCDEENLADLSCQGLQLGAGVLRCNPSCRWDTSGCEVNVRCGDGTVAPMVEVCEETDLQGETCATLGYYGGDLTCSPDCRAFVLESCESAGRCGAR